MSAPRLLIIGVDGVRYDAVRRLPTPRLDAVAARGFLVPVTVDPVAPTISGPSWASMLTGTLAGDHAIMDNDLSTGRLVEHPDVLTTTRRQRAEVATFAAAGWGPLVRAESGGPLLVGGGFSPADLEADTEAEWHRADDEVVAATLGFLAGLGSEEGALVFSYLHAVDACGHGIGTGAAYDAMIEASDARIGRLVDAVGDDWTVIVVTDHGHRDGGGHGGDDHHERTAWIAASGPGLPIGDVAAEQVDVAGQVYATFDLHNDDPAMVGVPFGTR